MLILHFPQLSSPAPSHEDVLAPAVNEGALPHAFGLAAEGEEGVARSPPHVHRWLLLAGPHKEVLFMTAVNLLTRRSHCVRVVVSVDELDFRAMPFLSLIILVFGFLFALLFIIASEYGASPLAAIFIVLVPIETELDEF